MVKVGVIGSSKGDDNSKKMAEIVGSEIAKSGYHLLTGGCTGVPHAAIIGAKKEDGLTVGISPAENEKEHIEKYNYPTKNYDLIIYTGFGLKGRNIILVRSCDAVIAISGSFGTLNELTIAHSSGKVIGLLTGVPGISSEFEDLADRFGRPGKEIVSGEDPVELFQSIKDSLERS